jgi:hypothetical protein
LDLIEHIAVMQQTISYLKLEPQDRACHAKLLAEQNVRQVTGHLAEITSATEEIQAQRNDVIASIRSAFSQLQVALAVREQKLVEEVSELAERNMAKYHKLQQEAERTLKVAQKKEEELKTKSPSELTEADIAVKPNTMKVPSSEFNLKFVWDEDQNTAYLQKVGRMEKWRVKAPHECTHFTNVTYWMLPPCCLTYYCCNKCHDLKERHPWQYATRMACMYCEKDQDYRKLPNVCEHCSVAHKGVVSK